MPARNAVGMIESGPPPALREADPQVNSSDIQHLGHGYGRNNL